MKPPYQTSNDILHLIMSISEKIGEINAANLQIPSPELRKRSRIRTIHSSLGIEGNTLTVDQITAIIENRRVAGPKKDIREVQNAMNVYHDIKTFKPYSLTSFCKAHSILMQGLISDPGRFRTGSVGIMKGHELAHLAPPGERVKGLMKDLFGYLKNDTDVLLIKSCVFHYEMEFIHPFIDGNGRMGRLWQTILLAEQYPVFEYLPVESIIIEKQAEYYAALSGSDKRGESTAFIEFMLMVIEESLEGLLRMQNVSLSPSDRLRIALEVFNKASFSRQDYLRHFKTISTATASRDLKYGVDEGLLEKIGDKRLTKYSFIS